MISKAKAYLEFLWRSKNEHGVHSPFVFDLLTKCLYDKTEFPEYKILKEHRNAICNDGTKINVCDFGAGSRVFKSDLRRIKDIAGTAGISEKRAKMLFRTAKYFQVRHVLEIGTSVGLGTVALALANDDSEVVTVEGCTETANASKKYAGEFGFRNIDFIVGEFSESLREIGRNKFDLIYFDGNHQKEATLKYFETLLPTIHNDSVWIFDDIHWSEAMQQAWEIIKSHPQVTVTIDTFQWGFVFFREEQVREHFTLRT